MVTKWWFSSKAMTILVVEDQGIIIRTAPVVGKFVGQPISNLEGWMTKHGKFRKCNLDTLESINMAPPKSPAKSAPKPAGSAAPAQESVFAAMKKQGALAKHMAKAKKVVAVREFDGPDGDYLANLSRVSHYTKDGSLGIVLEYRATGEGDTQGQKMVVFFSFKQTDRETVQEVQDRFFETLQLMGIDTDIEDDQLNKELNALIANKAEITLRVKTSKNGGKFINIVGLASAAKEVAATEYVEETVAEEETTEVVDEETTDEWDEEVPEEEEVEEESDPALPSSWVGYAMLYKGTEVEVLEADDTAMKCVIKAGGKKLKVAFSALSPPAE